MLVLLILFVAAAIIITLFGGETSESRRKRTRTVSHRKRETHKISLPKFPAQPAMTNVVNNPPPPPAAEPRHFPPDLPPAGWNPTADTPLPLAEAATSVKMPELAYSQLMKNVLKQFNVREQEIIRMVQKGSALSEIERRYGKEAADGAQALLDKVRAQIGGTLEEMLMADMTSDEVVEKLGREDTIPITASLDLSVQPERKPRARQKQQSTPAQTDSLPSRRSARKSSEIIFRRIPDPTPAPEGERKRKTHFAAVRSVKLRKAAIQIHGRSCCVCGFNFDDAFGNGLAQGYIEIHHLNRISAGVRNTDPATDLAPLCGNCHAMADRLTRHQLSAPGTINELRALLLPEPNILYQDNFALELPAQPNKRKRPLI